MSELAEDRNVHRKPRGASGVATQRVHPELLARLHNALYAAQSGLRLHRAAGGEHEARGSAHGRNVRNVDRDGLIANVFGSGPSSEVTPLDEHIGGDDPEGIPEAQHGAVIPYGNYYLRGRVGEAAREAAYYLKLVQCRLLSSQ